MNVNAADKLINHSRFSHRRGQRQRSPPVGLLNHSWLPQGGVPWVRMIPSGYHRWSRQLNEPVAQLLRSVSWRFTCSVPSPPSISCKKCQTRCGASGGGRGRDYSEICWAAASPGESCTFYSYMAVGGEANLLLLVHDELMIHTGW